MPTCLLIICVALMLFVPARLRAQEPESAPMRWGASVSFVPAWKVPQGDSPFAKLAEVSLTGAEDGNNVKASDFRIGFVRGRHLQGDWGVSFVRRSFKEGSTQGAVVNTCSQANINNCEAFGVEYTYHDVTLRGIEANKFITFGTIKNVVQLGLDIAIGVGWMKGTAEKREPFVEFVFVPGQQQPQIISRIDSSEVPATELSPLDPTLLGRVEFAGAVILPRGLKVRVSGGMNFPGMHTASVSLMYFFGPD